MAKIIGIDEILSTTIKSLSFRINIIEKCPSIFLNNLLNLFSLKFNLDICSIRASVDKLFK